MMKKAKINCYENDNKKKKFKILSINELVQFLRIFAFLSEKFDGNLFKAEARRKKNIFFLLLRWWKHLSELNELKWFTDCLLSRVTTPDDKCSHDNFMNAREKSQNEKLDFIHIFHGRSRLR